MKKIAIIVIIILSVSLLLISISKPYKVNSDKCIGCRLCVSKCPVNAIIMVKGKAVIDTKKCVGCGICSDGDDNNFNGCPVDAINQVGTEKIVPDSSKVDSLKKEK